MNPIAKMLIDMAKFYSYELDKRQLEMYVGVLEQFPLEAVLESGRRYIHDTKNTKFPVPPHLIVKDYLPQEVSHETLAKEAAARVIQAVTRFGWPNAGEAREFVGELGWRAVERFGGWTSICQNMGVSISPDTIYAQMRELCRSTLELGGAGIQDQPIGLTSSRRGLATFGEIVSSLAEKRSLNAATQELLQTKVDNKTKSD